ncbi:transposase [Photobacterium aphoticum]|uniref:Transposase n=1 Tax=Photobacterium aphoticum TaxID=754436 RepID=A0A0J1GH91_9GAMM|nr:transposase [Photobacterium aphoticum]
MINNSRRRFSAEFKLEGVQMVITQGRSVADVAEALGIGFSTLGKWVRQVQLEQDGKPVQAQPITDEQREIAKLKKEIEQLKMDKEVLKKATALLMSDSLNNSR